MTKELPPSRTPTAFINVPIPFLSFLTYNKCNIILTQNQLNGITKIIAGIISTTGNIFNFSILKPAATIKKPPQALKSAILSGVVNGTIKLAD